MTSPIFYEGELVIWAGVMAHQTDVGGMDNEERILFSNFPRKDREPPKNITQRV